MIAARAHLIGMLYPTLHKRLAEMRERTLRQPSYRLVYGHALTVAHLEGQLVAADHPGWERLEAAIARALAGDPEGAAAAKLELARLRPAEPKVSIAGE